MRELAGLVVMFCGISASCLAQETLPRPIRFMQQPALAPDGRKIAFEYQGDLWTVAASGGTASRLTIHETHDQLPAWSPDGKWIAFSSRRAGSYDVWLMSAEGGKPRQLTFHSADDLVNGWTPDGSEILFTSNRETTRAGSIYAVNVSTSATRLVAESETALSHAAATPDGKSVACTRGGSWTRKGYRGSGNGRLMLFPLQGGAGKWLAQTPENERWPLFAPDGQSYVYVSDRDGVANLWRRATKGGAGSPLTRFKDGNLFFPTLSKDGSRLVFSHNFTLWTLSKGGEPRELTVYAPTDDRANTLRRETFTTGAQEIQLSPDGRQLAFVVHGEVFVQPVAGSAPGSAAPADMPDEQEQTPGAISAGTRQAAAARRLTETPQREQDIAWSPDGTKLAFTSDRDGNGNIYLLDIKTKATRQVTKTPNSEHSPVFSPDGKSLAFLRGFNGAELCLVPVEGGPERILARDPAMSGVIWSPDSRWLAYERIKSHSAGAAADIFIVAATEGKPINVTRYPVINSHPEWSADGAKLFFLSNRSANTNLWSINLQSDPLPQGGSAPAGESEETAQAQTERAPGKQAAKPAEKKLVEVKIDVEDIQTRARQITRMEGNVGSYAVSPDGRTIVFATTVAGQSDLWRVAAAGGVPSRLTQSGEAGGSLQFTPDSSRVVYLSRGAVRSLPLTSPSPAPLPLAFSARMDIDTHADLMEIFDEAWRKMRDAFYDEKMHGSDWNRVRDTYRPLLEDITYKEDFTTLFALVLGELNSSHVGLSGPPSQENPATASLGIALDDHYTGPGVRVASVMPKGPADRDRSRLHVGDIILKVDDAAVTINEAFYKLLEDKAGKTVNLLVGKEPKEETAQSVRLRAITTAAYKQLEYDRWVKAREQQTEKLSGGRIGYIHLSAMNDENLEKFKRAVFGDLQPKEGLILDVRFNGGGSIADEILAILQNRVSGYRTIRGDAVRTTSPLLAWTKPTNVLINEVSFSNAEVFPWGLKALKLGKVVGVATNGGVIGTGATTLMDGSTLRTPAVGAYTMDGLNMEHNGCPPDILVENTPEDVQQKHDRQLERAVQDLLERLKSP